MAHRGCTWSVAVAECVNKVRLGRLQSRHRAGEKSRDGSWTSDWNTWVEARCTGARGNLEVSEKKKKTNNSTWAVCSKQAGALKAESA